MGASDRSLLRAGTQSDHQGGTELAGYVAKVPSGIHIHLLGEFKIVAGAHSLDSQFHRRRKAGQLLKLLALAPGRALHRDQLLDVLW